MKCKLLTVALLSVAGVANATNWEIFSGSSDSIFYVATDRISTEGDYLNIWDKQVYTRRQKAGKYVFDYAVSQETVFCSGRSYRTNASTTYRNDGTSVLDVPGDGKWHQAVPDTVMDAVISKLCAPH
jgi:hypothetical protein